MSPWTDIFLGVIALSTLTTAIMQVVVLLAAGRLARRMERVVERIEGELAPAFGHINSIGRDASRVMAMATTQVERIDRLVSELTARIDEILAKVQNGMSIPVREGKAVVTALRAVLDSLREARQRPHARPRRRSEDDDVLFI